MQRSIFSDRVTAPPTVRRGLRHLQRRTDTARSTAIGVARTESDSLNIGPEQPDSA